MSSDINENRTSVPTDASSIVSTLHKIVLLCLVLFSLSACAVNRDSAEIMPGTDLSKFRTFYVVRNVDDDNDLHGLMVSVRL